MDDRFRFRAWHKRDKKMLLEDTDDSHGIDERYGSTWDIFQGALEEVQENGWVLMQCTGLKDKNGKLIYEGDIVKSESWPIKNVLVKFGLGSFDSGVYEFQGFFLANSLDPSDSGYEVLRMLPLTDKLEVIGNIYENPELLNE